MSTANSPLGPSAQVDNVIVGEATQSLLAGSQEPRGRRRVVGRWSIRWQLVIPAMFLSFMILMCFLGPIVLQLPAPSGGDLTDAREPLFSPGHPLGTDGLGNDLLSRALHGGRVSFIVGGASVVLALFVGGSLGLIGGYSRGLLRIAVMRIVDVLLSIPSLVIAVAMAAYLGPGMFNVILAVAVFIVPANARLAQAATSRVLPMDYVLACELQGRSRIYIAIRHVVPNIVGEMVTYNVVKVATAMLIEAALSYLGVGVRPPRPSWGSMISQGSQFIAESPYIVFVPAVFLFLAVLCVNLLGDAIRQWWEER